MARGRTFTQEFKDEAVRMVLDGPCPVSHVAKEIGVHDTTLGNWVSAYKRRQGGNAPELASSKNERELQLERENRKLREEVAFLKKAAAFFASENR